MMKCPAANQKTYGDYYTWELQRKLSETGPTHSYPLSVATTMFWLLSTLLQFAL